METGSSMLNVNLIYSQPATNSIEVSHEVLKQVVRFSCSGFALSQLDKQTPIKTNCYIFSSENEEEKQKIDAIAQYSKDFFAGDVSHFICQTPICTQIPAPLFSPVIAEKTKQLLVSDVSQYHFLSEYVAEYDLYNIVAWNKDLYNQIKTSFPKAEIVSQATVLLKMLAGLQNDILMFFDTRQFSVLCKRDGKFVGMNSFQFSNEADCCYYLLAFLQKCYPNATENLSPLLCGNIAAASPLYQTLSRYFSQINILTNENLEFYFLYGDILYI